jgi:hypothetical protein
LASSIEFNYKLLNFNEMKKQILFMMFLSLAFVFAGVNDAFAQLDPNYPAGTAKTPAIPLGCAADFGHLNPNPGQEYTYEISTTPAAIGSVHWFVTDESDVIYLDGGAAVLQPSRDNSTDGYEYILEAEAGVYNVATNTQKTIDITWQYFEPANEVLLVAYVTTADGCTDNVEVWRIEPAFSFTLDVLAMDDDGNLSTGASFADECVSPVVSATYDGTELTMDYGINYLYFSVTAANFVGSWMPDLDASITAGVGGAIGDIHWAYPTEATETGTWNLTTDAVNASAAATNGVVGVDGEHIIVRVEIINDAVEDPVGATAATVTLTIDGIMYDAANLNYTNPDLRDVEEVGGVCIQDGDPDEASHSLLPRPLITEVTPDATDGPFEPKP